MERVSYAEAVRRGLAEEMRRDADVWVLGEDLTRAHGSTSSTQYLGLVDEFGPRRIVDTPISESTIMGAAVGAALAGTRPIAELRNVDFGLCAIDELVNQAAKIRYMFGGQARVPLVTRQGLGLKRSLGAQHTQSNEAWFVHTPGLVVVTPATPADGRGLLKASIRCDDPVVFLEHKELWGIEGEVDFAVDGVVALGAARIASAGTDLTIVTWSRMVLVAEQAALELAGEGISVEVIDLRTLWPWDRGAVFNSVRKTGRLLVAQEAVLVGGFANDIAAEVGEHLHSHLRAPVRRIGAPRMPVAYSPPLEDEYRIESPQVAAAARALMQGVRSGFASV